jgi:hypothetical protein
MGVRDVIFNLVVESASPCKIPIPHGTQAVSFENLDQLFDQLDVFMGIADEYTAGGHFLFSIG